MKLFVAQSNSLLILSGPAAVAIRTANPAAARYFADSEHEFSWQGIGLAMVKRTLGKLNGQF